MPLLLPGAFAVDSVMTQRCGYWAKLDRERKEAQPRLPSTSSATKLLPSPSSLSEPTSQSQHHITDLTFTGFRSNAVTQIRKLPSRFATVLLILILLLISNPAMGKPWSNEQPDHVIFRSQICQPMSSTNLKKMMGSHYDEKLYGSAAGDPSTEGYQGDDPRLDLVDYDTDAGGNDERWKYGENSELSQDDGADRTGESAAGEESVESRSWLPRRKVLNRHIDNEGNHSKRAKTIVNGDDLTGESAQNIINSGSYTYMRRRRRRSLGDSEARTEAPAEGGDIPEKEDTGNFVNNKIEGNTDDSSSKDTKSTNSIQLQLFLNGRDKKQRKKLKQKLKQQPASLSKPPPWECKFSQRMTPMRKGVFPQWVLEGRCETDKCFYRLYNCEPIKYTLKLLLRDPNKCNPLPSVTNLTVYEERWELVQKYVTVGCNCVSPITKTTKPRSRRHE